MPIISAMLKGGMQAVFNYLSAHVITCLVSAFFIAGAMAVLVTKGAVITAAYFMLVVVMATLTG